MRLITYEICGGQESKSFLSAKHFTAGIVNGVLAYALSREPVRPQPVSLSLERARPQPLSQHGHSICASRLLCCNCSCRLLRCNCSLNSSRIRIKMGFRGQLQPVRREHRTSYPPRAPGPDDTSGPLDMPCHCDPSGAYVHSSTAFSRLIWSNI